MKGRKGKRKEEKKGREGHLLKLRVRIYYMYIESPISPTLSVTYRISQDFNDTNEGGYRAPLSNHKQQPVLLFVMHPRPAKYFTEPVSEAPRLTYTIWQELKGTYQGRGGGGDLQDYPTHTLTNFVICLLRSLKHI